MNKRPDVWIICEEDGSIERTYHQEIKFWLDKLGISNEVLGAPYFEAKNDGLFFIKDGKVREILAADLPKLVMYRAFKKELYDFVVKGNIPTIPNRMALMSTGDKLLTHKLLAKKNILQPKFLAYNAGITYAEVVAAVGAPFVLKTRFGDGGGHGVFLVHNEKEYVEVSKDLDLRQYLFQEYISKSFGRDVRVYIWGGKAIDSSMRQSASGWKSNLHQGGGWTPYQVSNEIKLQSEEISKVLGGDILSVDYLLDGDKLVFCESNAIPGFTVPETLANKSDLARASAQYIKGLL